MERKPEFDKYAGDYFELTKDPLRNGFVENNRFFFERKWLLLKRFLESSGRKPSDTSWVDVGCGQGDLLRYGLHAMRRVAGCDLSTGMLKACEGLDVRLQPSPTELPFEDNQFDLATAVCVYHHVEPEYRAKLTSEIARILRPGGVAAIIEHNPFNPATQWIVSRLPVDADAKLLTAGLTRRILRDAGLSNPRTEYFLYFPEKIYRKISSWENALTAIPLGGQYVVYSTKR